jgi:hypothetical protein
MRRIVMAVALLVSSALYAQQLKTYVVTQRRQGVIEFIDPVALTTVSRIHFAVGHDSVGLNGVAASSDGMRLYVEGPTTEDPSGCCNLYSIDLATLQARKVADIWGSPSRAAFVLSGGIMYPRSEIFARGDVAPTGSRADFLDATGRFLFRVRSSDSPALDLYDLAQGGGVRHLVTTGIDGQWYASGAWSRDRFFLYAARTNSSTARLWAVSTTAAELGPGVAVEPFDQAPVCSKVSLREITAAGGNLFVYERFGTKLDSRDRCGSNVPGGAWMVDPDTGRLLKSIAPELHFTDLIGDRAESVLYGLAAEGGSSPKAPITLVRIDARNGRELQSRNLDEDWWWITVAPLQNTPTGEVQIVP